MWDHPRVCGEKFNRYWEGKIEAGITPACAGKRLLRKSPLTRFGDHPRVCGEKPMHCPHGINMTGSPPRVRGKD